MALSLPAKLAEAKESSSIFLIELYILYLKTGTLYFCGADQDITYNGQLYKAFPIQRDKTNATTDSKVDNCKLKISNVTDSFTASLFSGQDFRSCDCAIFQILYPDALEDPTLISGVFYGYLDSPVLNSKDATFEVEVKSETPTLENARTLQLSCNAVFSDQDSCFADLGKQTGIVQPGTTGNTIYIQQSMPDGYWSFGIITCGYESKQISNSVGNCITVDYPFMTVPTQGYTIERGCDKSYPGCGNHGQQTNFSGFPGIPYEMVVTQY